MPRSIIFERNGGPISEWVRLQMPYPVASWGAHSALGLVREDGFILGGAVYNHWHHPDIALHAALTPHWADRRFLHAVFDYPFNHIGCRRITGYVAEKNLRAQHFNERLGYRLEGRKRHALPDGSDVLIYGLLKEECRFLRGDV